MIPRLENKNFTVDGGEMYTDTESIYSWTASYLDGAAIEIFWKS